MPVEDNENGQSDESNYGQQGIEEEMASIRRQLTEAAELLDSLSNRVSGLEARTPRRTRFSPPELAADVEDAAPEPSAQQQAVSTIPASIPTSSESLAPEAVLSEPMPAPDMVNAPKYDRADGPEIPFNIDWEQALGRNWFAIIGGIAVALGIGFFLKLAFDNDWIGDTGRIVLGVVVGLGFLGAGEYAQRRVPRWAQPVTASGAAILYLSIYAAFGLYELIRPDVAFLLLGGLVAVAALLALRYESIVIALLGVAGAFISPVLLGPDLPDERLAPAYILLVDVGILGISTFRNWRWLTLVGLVCSYGIFGYWLSEFSGDSPVSAYIILTGVFITFAASTPLFHILWRRLPGVADLSLMSLNATLYFLLTAIILWEDYEGWFGLIAFSLAAFYGIMAFSAIRRSGAPARVAVFALGIATIFLTMAFPLQFSGFSVAVAWAAQGAVMGWMGFYLGRWQPRAFGIAVLSLAIIHLILFDFWVDAEGYIPILNTRAPAMVAVVVAFYAVGLIYWRNREADGQFKIERWAAPVMFGIANLATVGLLSFEAVNYLDGSSLSWGSMFDLVERVSSLESDMQLGLTLLWALYGSAVALVGLRMRYEAARWGGLALLAVAVWKLLTYDTINVHIEALTFTPFINIRFLAFALVLALASILAFSFKRSITALTEREGFIIPALLITANVVALWMLSQEIIYYFGSLEARYDADYASAIHLSLTVLWAVYSMCVISAGIVVRSSRVRLAGIGLLAIPVAKLFVFDVFLLDLAYRVAAFMTLGCLLLGMGLVYQRYSHAVRGFLFGADIGMSQQDG